MVKFMPTPKEIKKDNDKRSAKRRRLKKINSYKIRDPKDYPLDNRI